MACSLSVVAKQARLSVVFDASAALVLLNREPGWPEVLTLLDDALISTPNATEVLSRLIDFGMSEREAWERFRSLELECVSFTQAHARAAAQLRNETRNLGLSLGDRACLALARSTKRPAVTADRLWAQLDLGIKIIMVR